MEVTIGLLITAFVLIAIGMLAAYYGKDARVDEYEDSIQAVEDFFNEN